MKMKQVFLDESILDLDSWLTEEKLKELTESVFGVKIEDKVETLEESQTEVVK